MPIIDITVNKYIDSELFRLNDERSAKHEPSGKLSASMLYQPVRFQLLKTLEAPRKAFDAYTLAKFKRGIDVEEWYVSQLRGSGVLVEDKKTLEGLNLEIKDDKQAYATYKGTVGYVDSTIDTDKMLCKKGIIPNEIKSVTNMKMKRIKSTGIDWHYKIQACFYACAMGTDYYAVTIVSAEDLRSETHIFKTRDMKREVDNAITAYDKAVENWEKNKVLPAFAPNPHVGWTADIKYAMFEPEWVEKPDSWAIDQITKLNK